MYVYIYKTQILYIIKIKLHVAFTIPQPYQTMTPIHFQELYSRDSLCWGLIRCVILKKNISCILYFKPQVDVFIWNDVIKFKYSIKLLQWYQRRDILQTKGVIKLLKQWLLSMSSRMSLTVLQFIYVYF